MIDYRKFNSYFDRLSDYLVAECKTPLDTFEHPFMRKHEWYKTILHSRATEILGAKSWQESDVGSGKLIDRLVAAIEQKDNNLLDYVGRFGPGSVSHRFLREAKGDEQRTLQVEELIYGFYRGTISDERAFELFVNEAGGRYPLLGYLFFLKNDRKYVPIRPTYFDRVFNQLGVDLKTSGHCSWENYQQYCAVVAETRDYLLSRIEEEVRLIDAHSFLWILSWVQLEQAATPTIPSSVEISATRPSPTSPKAPAVVEPFDGSFTPIDFAENDRRQRAIGQVSEDCVLQSERQRLINGGREDLAKRARLVSDDYRLGYDIESYEEDGTPRQIEVKTAQASGRRRSFFISDTEVSKSEQLSNYHLYLVTWVDGRPGAIQYIRHPQLRNADRFSLKPQDYLVYFEEV